MPETVDEHHEALKQEREEKANALLWRLIRESDWPAFVGIEGVLVFTFDDGTSMEIHLMGGKGEIPDA